MNISGGLKLHEIAERRELTRLLKQQIQDDEVWERAWRYCKKLASFSRTPVSLKEYLRMESFSEDECLVEEVFHVIKNYEVPHESRFTSFDTIGYFYSIALLSVAKKNRKQYLLFLQELTEEWCREHHPYCSLLYRNMKRLSKEYPDLKELETKLSAHIKADK